MRHASRTDRRKMPETWKRRVADEAGWDAPIAPRAVRHDVAIAIAGCGLCRPMRSAFSMCLDVGT